MLNIGELEHGVDNEHESKLMQEEKDNSYDVIVKGCFWEICSAVIRVVRAIADVNEADEDWDALQATLDGEALVIVQHDSDPDDREEQDPNNA